MSTWRRHVHVRPHCFILTEACSCRLELAYFVGKISKNRPVCKNAVALAYYGSCRLLVMGSCSKISITKDRGFVKCRQVREGKAKALPQQGHGKRLIATKALSVHKEEYWAALEISYTWRTKSRVTPLCSEVYAHALFVLVFQAAKSTMNCLSKISGWNRTTKAQST